MSDETKKEIGGTGGLTLRSLDSGFEFDLNVTYRKQPSRFIEGGAFEQYVGAVTLTKRNLFLNRQPGLTSESFLNLLRKPAQGKRFLYK